LWPCRTTLDATLIGPDRLASSSSCSMALRGIAKHSRRFLGKPGLRAERTCQGVVGLLVPERNLSWQAHRPTRTPILCRPAPSKFRSRFPFPTTTAGKVWKTYLKRNDRWTARRPACRVALIYGAETVSPATSLQRGFPRLHPKMRSNSAILSSGQVSETCRARDGSVGYFEARNVSSAAA